MLGETGGIHEGASPEGARGDRRAFGARIDPEAEAVAQTGVK